MQRACLMPPIFRSTPLTMKDEIEDQRRAFSWALPGSLAVHLIVAGLVIFGLPLPLPQPEEEQAIKVDLVPPPAEQAEPAPSAEEAKPEEPKQAEAEPPPPAEEAKPEEPKQAEAEPPPSAEEAKPEEPKQAEAEPPPPAEEANPRSQSRQRPSLRHLRRRPNPRSQSRQRPSLRHLRRRQSPRSPSRQRPSLHHPCPFCSRFSNTARRTAVPGRPRMATAQRTVPRHRRRSRTSRSLRNNQLR